MTKKEMEKEFGRLLVILMEGNREQVKDAKKQIDRLLHRDRQIFQKSAPIILEYLSEFDQIKKIENQAAFASGLSLFYLVLGDKYFDTLKDFTLKVIQHPNGAVREAMRKTADWLFVSMTARIHPFLYPKGKKLIVQQQAEQIEARQQYINLVRELEFIIDKYDDGDRRLQYIDEMKPSVNKSLQYFWARLTESRIYRELLEQTRPIPDEILEKRKEIESKLTAILKEFGSDFDLVDVKDIIYNEDGQSSLTDLIKMFDNGQDLIGMENVLSLVNEAWNYFPHKTLNGLSPAEKFLDYQKSKFKAEC